MNNNFFEKSKRGRGRAKHAVLDQYLKSYFATICQCRTWNTPVLYIDGFAGPGTYKVEDNDCSEEIGSPIVAYQAAAEHNFIEKFKKLNNTILLIFVEKDVVQSRKLEKSLKQLESTKTDLVKEIVQFRVVNNEFALFLEQLLKPENDEFVHSPMFVFADPFGYGGKLIPMRLFKRLLERQADQWLPTEVFITVMDGFARRFITDNRQSSSLNSLMGAENWHHLTEQGHLSAKERRNEFIDLYLLNLKKGIPKALTLKFGMKNSRNCHIYHLVYLTCHIKGIQEMKRAMWKNTQSPTEMVFSEWTHNRNKGESIVDKTPDQVAQCLYALIKNEFRGRSQVSGHELDNYIWLYTPYISNVKVQLKKLFDQFALNKERAFDKIIYQFT